jgi:hypothetical protein
VAARFRPDISKSVLSPFPLPQTCGRPCHAERGALSFRAGRLLRPSVTAGRVDVRTALPSVTVGRCGDSVQQSNQSKGERSITTLGPCCNGRAGQFSLPSLADERGLMTDEQQASVALPPIVSIFAGRDAPCQVAARSRPQPCARLGRFAANCKDRRRCEGRLARSRRESSPAFLLDSPFIVRQPVPPYAEVAQGSSMEQMRRVASACVGILTGEP